MPVVSLIELVGCSKCEWLMVGDQQSSIVVLGTGVPVGCDESFQFSKVSVSVQRGDVDTVDLSNKTAN